MRDQLQADHDHDHDHDPDLDAAVALARMPIEARSMPSVSLPLRLKTSPAMRSLLPTRLVVGRAAARGRARWEHNTAEREHALAVMEAIVGGTRREGEIAELAPELLVEEEVHRAFFWQPWRMERMDAASRALLQRALPSSRGVILSSCHLGPVHHHSAPITARGHTVYVVAGKWFFEQPSHDYWGRRMTRWWRDLRRRGMRLVSAERSFEILRALLREGEIVMIYFDMPGSRRTSFLGKPVMLASGTARLAWETDALVLPMRARRVGHRVWTDLAEPLDPRRFATLEELHDALAAHHERWILDRPGALEDPGRAGAWEGGASRHQWVRRG
jgi:lauroyl/myristoyl acyltransferase